MGGVRWRAAGGGPEVTDPGRERGECGGCSDRPGRCLGISAAHRAVNTSYRQIWMAEGVSAAGPDMLAAAAALAAEG